MLDLHVEYYIERCVDFKLNPWISSNSLDTFPTPSVTVVTLYVYHIFSSHVSEIRFFLCV